MSVTSQMKGYTSCASFEHVPLRPLRQPDFFYASQQRRAQQQPFSFPACDSALCRLTLSVSCSRRNNASEASRPQRLTAARDVRRSRGATA